MDNKQFGEFICSLRKEKELTQKEVAEKLHVTNKAVSKWENGYSYPDITLLEGLAEILGVSALDLLRSEKAQKDVGEMTDEDKKMSENLFASIHKTKAIRNGYKFIMFGCLIIMMIMAVLLYRSYMNHKYRYNSANHRTLYVNQNENDVLILKAPIYSEEYKGDFILNIPYDSALNMKDYDGNPFDISKLERGEFVRYFYRGRIFMKGENITNGKDIHIEKMTLIEEQYNFKFWGDE